MKTEANERIRREIVTQKMLEHLDMRRRLIMLQEALEDVVRVTNPGDRAFEIATQALRENGRVEFELAKGTYHDNAERVSHSVPSQRREQQRSLR